MKYQHIRRLRIILSGVLLGGFLTGHSQNSIENKYLEKAGDNALAYAGEIGIIYNPYFYSNMPYYISREYNTGNIYFEHTFYPNQLLKIDLHKDQLIILTPEAHHGVVVNPRNIKKIELHGRVFIWHTPPVHSGLPTGYYMVMSDGDQVQLLCRLSYQMLSPSDKAQREFSPTQKYYIVHQGIHYSVKSRSSFNKIFPSLKKQMKAFEKTHKNEYPASYSKAEKKEQRFVRLATFCNETISKQAKP